MDLLVGGEDEQRAPRLRAALAQRPPGWVVGVLALLLFGTAAGAVVVASDLRAGQAREAARIEVDVLPLGATSSTVAGVARGELQLRLVNRRDQRVRLGPLQVEVAGLQVVPLVLGSGGPLAPFEERDLRIGFVVPDCDALVLPGALVVSLTLDGEVLQRAQIPVREAGAGGGRGVVLAACPDSARGADAGTATDIGVRPAGGSSRRVGGGAEGVALLEVRNGGDPGRLRVVTGDVPGVVFSVRRLDPGRSIGVDELVVVRLPFQIPDCGALERAGRLLLTVARFGAEQELELPIVAERGEQAGPQVTLPVVYGACR